MTKQTTTPTSREITVTSASAATAARATSMGETPDASKSRSTTIATMVAGFFTVLWPSALVAFLVGILGVEGLVSLSAPWWFGISAGAIFPVPLFWVTAYTWMKARELGEEARYMSWISERMTQPDQTAAREVATVGMAVRREVEGLTKGIEDALDKISTLEGAVAKQAETMDDVANSAKARADEIRLGIEEERHRLGRLSNHLKAQTEAITARVTEQSDRIQGLVKESEGIFDTATAKLDRQTRTFATSARDAVENAQEAGRELERQSSKLETISDAALTRADVIAGRYDRHKEAISEASARLNEENKKLETAFADQRSALDGISDGVTDQIRSIQASITTCTDDLTDAMSQAVSRADTSSAQFQEGAKAATELSVEAAHNIEEAAEKAQALAEEARLSLDAQAEEARKAIDDQSRYAKEMLHGLVRATQQAFGENSDNLRSKLEDQTAAFADQLRTAGSETRDQLDQQSKQTIEAVERANVAIAEASQTLAISVEQLGRTSNSSGELLTDAARAIEERVQKLPLAAEQTAAQIRSVLDSELNAFARLADEATRKIQKLAAAYERHLPNADNRQTFSLNKRNDRSDPPPYVPLSSRERAASRLANEVRHDVRSGVARPKSDWGWSELLASIDKPFGNDQHATDTNPEDFEDASSLRVIEALQAMAIDIDRALEDSPPTDLLRRYLNGERGLFTKRLVALSGREFSERIHDRYLEDGEFRDSVNQYIDKFESILTETVEKDREDILLDTFLSSNTGRVYLILGSAVGHFA